MKKQKNNKRLSALITAQLFGILILCGVIDGWQTISITTKSMIRTAIPVAQQWIKTVSGLRHDKVAIHQYLDHVEAFRGAC